MLYISYVAGTAGITKHQFDNFLIDVNEPQNEEDIKTLHKLAKEDIEKKTDAYVYDVSILNWKNV